jgi:hypothetical protein
MTETQWVTKFLEVLDKGIELYTEALETEKGNNLKWLKSNHIDDGICKLFERNFDKQAEVCDWVMEAMENTCYVYVSPSGDFMKSSRHDRFALRLQILKSIKEQLT